MFLQQHLFPADNETHFHNRTERYNGFMKSKCS